MLSCLHSIRALACRTCNPRLCFRCRLCLAAMLSLGARVWSDGGTVALVLTCLAQPGSKRSERWKRRRDGLCSETQAPRALKQVVVCFCALVAHRACVGANMRLLLLRFYCRDQSLLLMQMLLSMHRELGVDGKSTSERESSVSVSVSELRVCEFVQEEAVLSPLFNPILKRRSLAVLTGKNNINACCSLLF